jgi:divinyl protochlorophyllide a 8-vinyl-reductase
MTAATGAAGAGARIGPNAIIQVAAALRARQGERLATDLFAAAGLGHHLDALPTAMVEESEVTRLQEALRAQLEPSQARAVCREAGQRTADYLLANRIPRPVQWLLRALPAGAASRVLLTAIGRHAWTFAGSARFTVTRGPPLVLSIAGCAVCRGAALTAPACDYYAATFEHLYRELVDPRTVVTETECQACGGEACRFELRW